MSKDGECILKDRECRDGIEYFCYYDGWKKTNNTCPVCEDGEHKCAGENPDRIQKCVKGKWEIDKKCSKDLPVCDPVNLECIECVDDSYKCTNDELIHCVNNHWEVAEKCLGASKYCDAENKTCATRCKQNQTQCSDGKISTCNSNGMWEAPKDCPYNVCLTETRCKECETEGEYACIYDRMNLQVLKICENGLLTPVDGVSFCLPGCAGAEEPNCHGERLWKCYNNITWAVYCKNGCVNDQCFECQPGAIRCIDGQMEECVSPDGWKFIERCQSGTCIDESSCSDYICQYRKTKCEDGKQYHCTGHEWIFDYDCEQGACYNDTLCKLCEDNEIKCEGHYTLKCLKNAWSASKSCAEDGHCLGKNCVDCEGTQRKCSKDGDEVVCSYYHWKTVRNCIEAGYAGCDNGYCYSCDCSPGEYYCEYRKQSDGSTKAIYHHCSDGCRMRVCPDPCPYQCPPQSQSKIQEII